MTDTEPELLVAAAVLRNAAGEVLLAQRPDDVHQGGLWEFPGGKVEPGEAVDAALRRELAEEIGVEVGAHRPLIRIRHRYPDRAVVLDVHRVDAWRGEPRGLEGQPLAWVSPDRLRDYAMPAADLPIVDAIRLPSEYLITPPCPGDEVALLAGIERVLADGIRLVQLRLPAADFPCRAVASEVQRLCADAGADLLINADVGLAEAIGCGVHLTSRQLSTISCRPLSRDVWVAASCHGAAELAAALRLGVDFAVLSPVKPTASHPHASSLGWPAFARLVEDVPLPVFALGGLGPGDLADAWSFGAQGIAAIRGLWVERLADR